MCVVKVKLFKLKLLIKILSSQNLRLYLITKKANQPHLRHQIIFLGNIIAVTCLGDAPNSDLTFNVFKPHNIAGKPKPFEKNISRFEYRFGSIILVDTH